MTNVTHDDHLVAERIATAADRFVFEVRQLGADTDAATSAVVDALGRADAAG